MANVFPGGSSVFQQDNAPHHTTKTVQDWLEQHDKELKLPTWHPKSPNLKLFERWQDAPGTSPLRAGPTAQPTEPK